MMKKIRERGISLKAAHIIMMAVTLIIAALLLVETVRTSSAYKKLSKATDNYIVLQKSAYELMNASDYLTEEVQCFAVTSDLVYMNNYFEEANVRRRRESSLEKMAENNGDSAAYKELLLAMDASVKLMETEFYSMRLVLEAKNDSSYPDEIAKVQLSAEDAALSSSEKLSKAQQMVHSFDYNKMKETIRYEMNNCLANLEAYVREMQETCDKNVSDHVTKLLILILVETAAIIFVLWMTSYLGINPILKGVQKIKEDSTLPIIGSYEFRYLAKTYNKMYEAFKKSIASLNYEASHDKLTGIYNRAGYDVLRQSIDIKTSALLLIDADKFKEINDSHGHTIGDIVLKKIASTLTKTFRSEDYVCRIGGDEFAVFMLHVSSDLKELIEAKVRMINDILTDTKRDSIPPISVSVGVAFGEIEQNISEMTKHADQALYKVKERGRRGCCFY